MKPIVLASTSPRRLQMFRLLGVPFEAVAPDYEEDNALPLSPPQLVGELALGKAKAVAASHPAAIVIAADTLVALDGQILAKPTSPAAVGPMIQSLSGRWHSVFTGLAIINGQNHTIDTIETKVHFSQLTSAQIGRYASLTEPLDKAGAYGIQPGSAASLYIDRVEGDYQAVVGLPIHTLAQRLAALGIDLLDYAR